MRARALYSCVAADAARACLKRHNVVERGVQREKVDAPRVKRHAHHVAAAESLAVAERALRDA